MTDLLLKDECYRIVGACMEVHRTLGCGFLESVYQEALALEFNYQNIPFEREKLIEINYKGIKLAKHYFADFICYDKIILELKALSAITSDHEAQILNYLKATGMEVGILVNFGEKSLTYERKVFNK
ncbi:MAG: GxxExxY protein [Candidatus Cloacimonetes bacterium]|nr:GxxExxY protein [Candidatus Cloacimonadota bacterium]